MMGGNQNNGFPQPPTNMLNIPAARVAMHEARMPRPPTNMLNIPAAQAQATFIQKNRKTRKNKRKF